MKYLLIVSQYRWSRHMFICELPTGKSLFQNARALIEELENYKRTDKDKPIDYGDMQGKHYSGANRRYNVNDSGDIYFIPLSSLSKRGLHEIKTYWEDSYKGHQGFKSNEQTNSIYEHHDYAIISEMVMKYFTVI